MNVRVLEGGYPSHAKFEATFPSYAYFDEKFFLRELENIWFKSWLCVGRVEEIPNIGDYITANIGYENLIIIRARDGSINTFYNVCRHRGSRLCEAEKGNFSNGNLSCHYHRWLYDGCTGELINAPNIPNDAKEFKKEERSLVKVATEIWDGYIWINLDPNPPSLKEAFGLPESWSVYKQYDMENLKLGEKKTYRVKANWKLIMENAEECYHCAYIHPELSCATPPTRTRLKVREDVPETEVVKHTGAMDLKEGFERVNIDGKAYRPPFEGLDEEEMRKIYYLHIYPHLFIGMSADYVFMATVFPVDPNESIVHGYWLFDPKVLADENITIQDAIDFWHITSLQDWKACELTHQGNRSRVYKSGGILTPAEWRTSAFKNYVLSKVGE